MKRLPPLALLGLAALAGCQSENPPLQGRLDPYERSQVMLSNPQLEKDLRVGQPTAVRDANGLLVVTVPVRSNINKTLLIDPRITFFDADKQPLGTLTAPTKALEPFTPDTLTFNSTSDRAADFQVDLRYAR